MSVSGGAEVLVVGPGLVGIAIAAGAVALVNTGANLTLKAVKAGAELAEKAVETAKNELQQLKKEIEDKVDREDQKLTASYKEQLENYHIYEESLKEVKTFIEAKENQSEVQSGLPESFVSASTYLIIINEICEKFNLEPSRVVFRSDGTPLPEDSYLFGFIADKDKKTGIIVKIDPLNGKLLFLPTAEEHKDLCLKIANFLSTEYLTMAIKESLESIQYKVNIELEEQQEDMPITRLTAVKS